MSMDDQYREMRSFTKTLVEFNACLNNSLRSLEASHESVSPHWQDEMRRQYDAQWQPLQETINRYVSADGTNYVEFLNIKLHALERYLYHG